MAPGQVLATVGTTKFDLFISTLCTPDVLRVLKRRGYKNLKLQIGHGIFEPQLGETEGIDIEYYRFKDSIANDIKESDLVISHAGAGSCIEVLDAKRKLLVVVNELLMDNHQVELAKQLYLDGYAYYCTCSELKETLENIDLISLKTWHRGKSELFTNNLDNIFGFTKCTETN